MKQTLRSVLRFLKEHGKAIGGGIVAGASGALAGADPLGVLALAIGGYTGVRVAPHGPSERDKARRR